MPVRPTLLERLVLFRLHRGPAPILDLFAAAGFRATTLALETGLFEALAAGHESPDAVAAAIDAHPTGVRHLLAFLEPLGYVRETADGYENTRMTRTWLLGDGPNVAPWLAYWQDVVFPYWDEFLETAIREGEPPQTMYEWLDDRGGWAAAQRGFRAVATLLADDVLDAIDLPSGVGRLLDVGGGHAYYAIEACRRRPALHATVIDAPEALGVARADIADADLDDRIELRGGDALTDDLGGEYDVAFCFNVIHGYDPATNRALFERIHDALAPDGRIIVLDQFAASSRLPVARTGLAFTGFVYATALGATVYDADAIAEWVRDAGFTDVSTTTFRTLPGIGVLEARRP